MKIRFKRDVLVYVDKTRFEEVWDVNYKKWEELIVEVISQNGQKITMKTNSGDILLDVPADAYETI